VPVLPPVPPLRVAALEALTLLSRGRDRRPRNPPAPPGPPPPVHYICARPKPPCFCHPRPGPDHASPDGRLKRGPRLHDALGEM